MTEIKPFKGQDYETLKSEYSEDNLFEDPLFSASDSSLYYSQPAPYGIVWKRPREVRRNAQFVVNDFDRCDMDQGAVGNCWFIAGCVGIMQSPELFAKVVPADQSFDNDYAGIFHFRFWLYGEWVDVVVDDRLPFWSDGKLVYSSNREEPNEFWCALLEKAYAKLYGSYENLEGGQTTDALIDMSGGIEETFDLTKQSASEKLQLWTILHQGFYKKAIMGCSISADARVKEARLSNGLVRGHAYTITKVAVLNAYGSEVKLVRIRNPWGNEVEWNGAWSDSSREWNSVSDEEKEAIGLVKDSDGEFWMSFNDFMRSWDSLQICHLSADSLSSEILDADENISWRRLMDPSLTWQCTHYQSEWIAGRSAGGCGQLNQAKYWTNPQFLITLTDVDADDNQNMATVIIALMQKDSRIKRTRATSSAEEFIQFRLFRISDDVAIDETKNTSMRLYANQLSKVGASGPYINSREVTKRFRIEPGNYLIIPSTYDADREAEFLLRIFTEKPVDPE